jgi:hypothetical protein
MWMADIGVSKDLDGKQAREREVSWVERDGPQDGPGWRGWLYRAKHRPYAEISSTWRGHKAWADGRIWVLDKGGGICMHITDRTERKRERERT